jgi:hypothetical protein
MVAVATAQAIENDPSLASRSVSSCQLAMRRRQSKHGGPVTVQSSLPSFAVLRKTVSHVTPPSRLSSMRTVPAVVLSQVMTLGAPIAHCSPPFGAVSASVPWHDAEEAVAEAEARRVAERRDPDHRLVDRRPLDGPELAAVVRRRRVDRREVDAAVAREVDLDLPHGERAPLDQPLRADHPLVPSWAG